MSDEKRLAYIAMAPQVLVEAFKKGWSTTLYIDGLPQDATFHHAWYEPLRRVFMIVCSSEEFEEISEGEEIPERYIVIQRVDGLSDSERERIEKAGIVLTNLKKYDSEILRINAARRVLDLPELVEGGLTDQEKYIYREAYGLLSPQEASYEYR